MKINYKLFFIIGIELIKLYISKFFIYLKGEPIPNDKIYWKNCYKLACTDLEDTVHAVVKEFDNNPLIERMGFDKNNEIEINVKTFTDKNNIDLILNGGIRNKYKTNINVIVK